VPATWETIFSAPGAAAPIEPAAAGGAAETSAIMKAPTSKHQRQEAFDEGAAASGRKTAMYTFREARDTGFTLYPKFRRIYVQNGPPAGNACVRG
jgi:hypothetical protein